MVGQMELVMAAKMAILTAAMTDDKTVARRVFRKVAEMVWGKADWTVVRMAEMWGSMKVAWTAAWMAVRMGGCLVAMTENRMVGK
jgi:hypothetical protein